MAASPSYCLVMSALVGFGLCCLPCVHTSCFHCPAHCEACWVWQTVKHHLGAGCFAADSLCDRASQLPDHSYFVSVSLQLWPFVAVFDALYHQCANLNVRCLLPVSVTQTSSWGGDFECIASSLSLLNAVYQVSSMLCIPKGRPGSWEWLLVLGPVVSRL